MSPIEGREEIRENKNFLKFVMFGLGSERYSVPVLKVKEIIATARIFPLPKMPDFVEGIISLRGEIIPIVDLRKRFELPEAEDTEEARIVVLEMDSFFVGISVDLVYEVIKIDEDLIEPPPPLVGGLRADYLEGVCEIGEHLITILNLEQIFSMTEKAILAKAAGGEEAAAENGLPAPSDSGNHDEFLGKWNDALSSGKAKQAEAPAAAPAPAAPEFEVGASQDVTVSPDGKIEHGGRMFFLGKRFAGQSVHVAPSAEGLVVSQGDEVIKRFRV